MVSAVGVLERRPHRWIILVGVSKPIVPFEDQEKQEVLLHRQVVLVDARVLGADVLHEHEQLLLELRGVRKGWLSVHPLPQVVQALRELADRRLTFTYRLTVTSSDRKRPSA